MTWPDAFYVTYDYDQTGAVTHIRENGATSGAGVLATYAYDNLGRMMSLTRGNGVVTTASFDAASRLTELAHDPAGATHDQTVSFTYNAAGQIASRTMANDIYAFTGYTNIDVNFTVNGLNQYLTANQFTFTHDARGNITSDGMGRTLSYDYDNRLTLYERTGHPTVSLSYDPAGRLYQLSPAGGAVTRFLYDGPNLVGEYDTSDDLLRRYVQGPGMDAPLVRYDGTGTSNKRWLLADERGSIIAETNASGAVVQVNTYDDYGIPASGNVGRFGYTGQLWLGEIGMYSYKNRIYHPGLARFLQPDPIGLAGGLNLYAYVGGDPINFTDPWGLDRVVVTGQRPACDEACQRERDYQDYQEWLRGVLETLNEGRELIDRLERIVPGIGEGRGGEPDPDSEEARNCIPTGYTAVPTPPSYPPGTPPHYMRASDGSGGLIVTPWRAHAQREYASRMDRSAFMVGAVGLAFGGATTYGSGRVNRFFGAANVARFGAMITAPLAALSVAHSPLRGNPPSTVYGDCISHFYR